MTLPSLTSPLSDLEQAGALTLTSLTLTDPSMPYERYEALAAYFGTIERCCAWWLGDLFAYGEKVYGEESYQAEHVTGLARQTLINRASICRRVPPERRRSELNFSMHEAVAALRPEEQEAWLDRAYVNRWTREMLRQHIKDAKEGISDPQVLPPPASETTLSEIAWELLRDAKESGDPAWWLVPREQIVRLREAFNSV